VFLEINLKNKEDRLLYCQFVIRDYLNEYNVGYRASACGATDLDFLHRFCLFIGTYIAVVGVA